MRSISFRIFIFLFLFVIGTDCKLCAQQRRTTRVVVDNQVKGPAISANYVGLSYEIAMLKPQTAYQTLSFTGNQECAIGWKFR